MAATADKARYFLEQSVPELQELQRKKIFSPAEIRSIAKRRSDFEHKINAPGPSPSDYAQYAEFEINVDQLRRKRVKRLGVKTTVRAGQRRVFFVFDRGNRKFPGDLGLWMQAIEYARAQKAYKKVEAMLTSAIRLHPTKVELWIYAAGFAVEENGDMTQARGYLQRGLRFCKNKKEIWLQDFKLEVGWIAKIHARRQILGIEQNALKEDVRVVGQSESTTDVTSVDLEGALLDDDEQTQDKVDVDAIQNLDNTPVLSGAIPIAIFDAAMLQFDNDSTLAFSFFETARTIGDLPPIRKILQHIHAAMSSTSPNTFSAIAMSITLSVHGISASDPKFPAALRDMLRALSTGFDAVDSKQRGQLSAWCRKFLEELTTEDMDDDLKLILNSKTASLAAS